nr:hypothetical protein COLO4_18387 [Ipomoea batatas]
MEDPFQNQAKKKKITSLPPKRGQVKAQIFKSIAEGISSSMASVFRKQREGSTTSTSAASTAAPPSPHTSDGGGGGN